MSLEDLEYRAQVVWTTFIVIFNVYVPEKACNIQIVSSVVEYVNDLRRFLWLLYKTVRTT